MAQNYTIKAMVFILCSLTACAPGATFGSNPDDQRPRAYERGTTDYTPGSLTVTQPDIITQPERSVEGIRVAGPDTDLVIDYWDILLQRSIAESGSPYRVFQIFRQRYRDLQVYQSGADNAALSEFRRWARINGVGDAFDDYWNL